jgi:hypothetical protein
MKSGSDQHLTTADIAQGTTTRARETTESMPAPAPSDAPPNPPAEEFREPEVNRRTSSQVDDRQAEQGDERSAPLFNAPDAEFFHNRWTDVQAGFVDDPRRAVESADGLVAEVIKNLAEAFSEERSGLERQWQQGEDVSTEELRLALRRYRSFFDRLLAV